MNFKEIQDLIKLINKTKLTEFKMKDGEFELSIRTELYQRSKTQVVAPSQQIVPIQPVSGSVPAPFQPAPVANIPADKEHAADAGAASEDQAEKAETNYLEVKSPMVGTFYRSPSPEKPVYVNVGDRIEKGDVVCIVEAMKLFNEIESEVSGTIVKVVTEDASPVEYDQVLFLVDPNG